MSFFPALTIPVRFAIDAAVAALGTLKTAGAACTASITTGFNGAREAVKWFSADSVAAGQAIQQVTNLAQSMSKSMVDGLNESAEKAKQLGDRYAALRDNMQEVAALTGKTNNKNFTLEQTRAAAAASMTPEKWTSYQKQFQSFAGAFVEGPQNRFQNNAKESADAQSLRFQQMNAEYALSRGTSTESAAQVAGGILQYSKPGSTPEDLMRQVSAVDFVLERAAKPKAQLQPQMNGLSTGGTSPIEAAKMLNLFSDIKNGSEGEYAMGANVELQKLAASDQGANYGIDRNMSPYERMRAFAENMAARNLSPADLTDELRKVTHRQEHVVGLEGLVNQGVKNHKFDMIEGYVQNMPQNYDRQMVADWRKTGTGRNARVDADQALKDVEAGSKEEAYILRQKEARLGLSDEIRANEPLIMRVMTGAGQALGLGDKEKQLIRAETSRMLVMDLEKTPQGQEWLEGRVDNEITGMKGWGMKRGDLLRNRPRFVNDALLSEGSLRQEQILKEIAKSAAKSAAAAKPPALQRNRPPGQPPRPGG